MATLKLLVMLLVLCLVCGDVKISDFLKDFSKIKCLETNLVDVVGTWKQSFLQSLQDIENSPISDSLICDVIHTSSNMISNNLKNYFYSNHGHTIHATQIHHQICPWSTAMLDVLLNNNYIADNILAKPVCKDLLTPIEYAIKLYNVNAVLMLLEYFPASSRDMCLGSHDCSNLYNLAAIKQDSKLIELIISKLPSNDDVLCITYSNMYYVCAIGLGCEALELIKPYLLSDCTLEEPPLIVSKLLSQQGDDDVSSINFQMSSTTIGEWVRYDDDVDAAGIQCQIPVINIEQLTAEDFRGLQHMSIPVLIKRSLRDSILFEEWSKSTLQSKYGHLEVLGGPIPYGEIFGEMSGVSTINEFLQYMSELDHHHNDKAETLPLYIFDTDIIPEYFSQQSSVKRVVQPVRIIYSYGSLSFIVHSCYNKLHILNATLIYQFILGPKGSGAPFHFHCNAINSLIYGRKKWYLYPPGRGYYSKVHPMQWTHDGKQLECVQHAGDIIYVPSGWSHSTLNVDECIGHAIEFDTSDC